MLIRMTVTDKANKFIILYITVGLVCINAENQKSYLRFKEGGKYTKENVSDIERYYSSIDEQIEEAFLENSIPCLDVKSQQYQKRPKPHTRINIQLGLLGVYSFCASRMELKSNIYMYQKWTDIRCRFNATNGQRNLTIYTRSNGKSHRGLENLWQPDTQILNSKSTEITETVTHIENNGMVLSRTRMSVTATCPMDLTLFPMDRQICSFFLQSSAHPDNEVSYEWSKNASLELLQGIKYQDGMMPDVVLVGYRIRENKSFPDQLTGGIYDQVIVDLILERRLEYFLWEVYMPATFIVLMSFISLVLDRNATAARIGLGVTTVLTITTLMHSAKSNLPHTSYPKAMGVFLEGCFLFTFITLVEYSITSYLQRKRTAFIKRANDNHINSLLDIPVQVPINWDKTSNVSDPSIGPKDEKEKFGSRLDFKLVDLYDPMGIKPSAVDVYARLMLPSLFILFQFIYWVTCFAVKPGLPMGTTLIQHD